MCDAYVCMCDVARVVLHDLSPLPNRQTQGGYPEPEQTYTSPHTTSRSVIVLPLGVAVAETSYAVAEGGISGSVAEKMCAPLLSGPGSSVALTHLSGVATMQTRTDVLLFSANPHTIERCGDACRTILSVCVVANLYVIPNNCGRDG